MSFRSLIVLVGMFCLFMAMVIGILGFRNADTAQAAGGLVMAIAGGLFIWISTIGKGDE